MVKACRGLLYTGVLLFFAFTFLPLRSEADVLPEANLSMKTHRPLPEGGGECAAVSKYDIAHEIRTQK